MASAAVMTADDLTAAEQHAMEAAQEAQLLRNREQLDSEAEARRRRVAMRKQQGAKLAAKRKAARQRRAFKLAGVWAAVIAVAFGIAVWFSSDISAWMSSLA